MTPSGEVRQYCRAELTLECDAPAVQSLDGDVVVSDWSGPGGARLRVPAFFDGGRTWRVRFAPTLAGRWTYRVASVADGGAEAVLAQGAVDVAPAAGENLLDRHGGLLKVAEGGRHLAHTDGTPFFWLGDTWWFCPSDLVPIDRSNRPGVESMYRLLVDTRAGQGFTVVQMASLGPLAAGRGVSGSFIALFDGRIDPAYWQTYDRYVDYATSRGIVPVLGFGCHTALNAPTLEQLQRLWRYVLARYGASPVTFLICGEYNLASAVDKDGKRMFGPADAQRVAKVLALGRFIKDHDPYRRAMTIHPWYFVEEKHQAWDEPWCDIRMIQGSHIADGPPPAVYLDLWRRTPTKPFLESEVTYEGIHGFTDAVVRRNAYKAVQCGSLGFTYGAHGLWYPTQHERDETGKDWGTPIPWWKALEAPGAAQLKHLRTAYESVEWWRLEPVSPGRLSWPADGGPPREVWVKADGEKTILAYIASCKQPSSVPAVALGGAGAAYAATWFDPRTGQASQLPEPVRADGVRVVFPPPPDTQDWVLILRRR